MKKVFKLFILMIIITPLFLHATENYEESEKRANNYINGDSYHDKGKYLIYGAGTPYMFSNGTSRVDSYNTFKNGGLINVEEFELSRNGSASSYLLTGSQYWSMTKSTTGQYYIGKYKVEFADPDSMRSSRYDTRVTQFVKPKTKVTGTGKYSDPWVFQAGYNVIVMTNNTSYGKFKVDGTTTDRVEQIVPSGNDFSVDMLITNGYRYSGKDDCGFTSPVSNSSTYLIRNVNRDITCTAYFDERIFKFELKSEHNYTKEPNYKVLYYKFNDGWYTEYDTGTKKVYNKINKIEPPEITGYQFLGYTYKNSPIISSGGDLSNIDSELLDYSKDNQELTASWKDVTKPKVAITVYNYDANATNKVGTDIIDDRQLYTGDAELLVNG